MIVSYRWHRNSSVTYDPTKKRIGRRDATRTCSPKKLKARKKTIKGLLRRMKKRKKKRKS